MKTYNILLIALALLFLTSCKMFKHEVERSLNKDIQEHMEKNFDTYATDWTKAKWDARKGKVITFIGFTSGVLGIIATGISIIIVTKKLKTKKRNKRKSKKRRITPRINH